MATVQNNWFEIERRVILFKPTTTLPDKTLLGWDDDPNLVASENTNGETLLYNCPPGTHYIESDGTMWFKVSAPNTWERFGSGAIQDNLINGMVLASSNTKIVLGSFIDNDVFDILVKFRYATGVMSHRSIALLSDGSLDHSTYSVVGKDFNILIEIVNESDNCIISIHNFETYDINYSIRVGDL